METQVNLPMKASGVILLLLLAGIGIYLLQFCSARFMLLRRSKSFTPYLYGIGGIFSLMLVTIALVAAFVVLVGPLH